MNLRPSSVRPGTLALAVLLMLMGCSDSFGPRVGSQYVLRSINGRPLPTSLSSAPPADSQFEVYRGAQYRVVSDSIIAYDLRVDLVTRHADGSTTSAAANCWDNYPFRYTRTGDSLILTPLAQIKAPPPPAPLIRITGEELLGDIDAGDGPIRLRFALDDTAFQPCSGFLQVAVK